MYDGLAQVSNTHRRAENGSGLLHVRKAFCVNSGLERVGDICLHPAWHDYIASNPLRAIGRSGVESDPLQGVFRGGIGNA